MNLSQERDCGTGSGGFKKGNDCAGGDGSSSRNNKEPLKGLPQEKIDLGAKWGVITPAPHQKARDVAHDYMESAGLKYTPPTDYVKVDPVRATKIADEYESMKHDPTNPRVKKAYRAMADETLSQYNSIIKSGVKFEFIPTEGVDPYAVSPRMATEDVRQNNHLYVFPTTGGFGTAGDDVDDNPLLEDSGVKWGDKPVSYNDIFRAVHDYFGHVKEGNGFRADGEENAWRSHSAMYSDEARLAMTSETRGQNSWVNFGKHSKHNKSANQTETKYAVQKTGLMSDWTMKEGSGQERDNDNDKRNTNERSATRNDNQVRIECGRGTNNASRFSSQRRFPIGRSVGGILGGLESQSSTTPRRSQRQSELATRRINMDIETRSFRVPFELRTDGENQTIVGYASTFDQPYPVDMVTEIIDRSAFTRTLSEKPDVYALIGHDPSRILGRTKNGTLSLSIDERGLKCVITPVMTRDAEDTLKLIASGCIDAMSFGFKVVKQAFGYADGKTTRRITDLELHEVSCVAFPANENATLSLRAKQMAIECRASQFADEDFAPKPNNQIIFVKKDGDGIYADDQDGNTIVSWADGYDDEAEFFETQGIKDMKDVKGFADDLVGRGLAGSGDIVKSQGKTYKIRSASARLETRGAQLIMAFLPPNQTFKAFFGDPKSDPSEWSAENNLLQSWGAPINTKKELKYFADQEKYTLKQISSGIYTLTGGGSRSAPMKLLELRNRIASPIDTETRGLADFALIASAGLGLFLVSKIVSGVLFFWYDCAYNTYGGGKKKVRVSAKTDKDAMAEVKKLNPEAQDIEVQKVKK